MFIIVNSLKKIKGKWMYCRSGEKRNYIYKKVFVGKTQKKSGEIQKSNIYKKKDKNGY